MLVAGLGNGSGTGATLELQTTIVDGGSLGSFTNDGLTEADAGLNTIKNFTVGKFVNDGKLLVTGNSTTLTLLNDTLNDYATLGGSMLVAGLGNGSGTGATLELQTTIVDGGSLGSFTNDGLTEADAGLNTIKNSIVGNFATTGSCSPPTTPPCRCSITSSRLLRPPRRHPGGCPPRQRQRHAAMQQQNTIVDGGSLGGSTNNEGPNPADALHTTNNPPTAGKSANAGSRPPTANTTTRTPLTHTPNAPPTPAASMLLASPANATLTPPRRYRPTSTAAAGSPATPIKDGPTRPRPHPQP